MTPEADIIPHFIPFQAPTNNYPLPKKFTFPFYYEPHPLSVLAAKELQNRLTTQTDWEHNFGIDPKKKGLIIGKMFGVLVVKNHEGQLGYLAAFSGKLANSNHHPRFVPPVFDLLVDGNFFKTEEVVLNSINAQIEQLENDPAYLELKATCKKDQDLAAQRIAEAKATYKANKKARKEQRIGAKKTLSEEKYNLLDKELNQASIKSHFYLKDLQKYWASRIVESEEALAVLAAPINELKQIRKKKSNALQQKIFEEYTFLNAKGESKNLLNIFTPTVQRTPPAGAGECAAPKLLQYAYLHNLKPIAMAEFWWGQSPKSAIRRHGHFYPACKGKCEPILGHMLEGLAVDDNPMLVNPAEGKEIEVIYEDDQILVINKPAEFLSVPGRNIKDSVYQRVKKQFPEITGPIIVHRLDMSTSGLMLIAKSERIYKYLQYQFINRLVKKRYVAILDGVINEEEGTIDLPLRLDFANRPQQMVCYEEGKKATTKWKVIERKDGKTRVHFFPITGRTHQLRVHAAHPAGLSTPIVGDDLYGIKADRLHLHAEWIEFRHPKSKQLIHFELAANF